MLLPDLVLRCARVVTPEGTRPGAIHIRRGRILGVLGIDEFLPGTPVEAVDGVIMPGVVDTHVHVNDFENTTGAAVAGGITTIAEMPSADNPVLTSAKAIEERCREAEGRTWTDVGFWGALVSGNAGELGSMFEGGALGFACALGQTGARSGVSLDELRSAAPILAKAGATLLAHGQLPRPVSERRWFGRRRYADHLARYPAEAEAEAIGAFIDAARDFNVRTHVLHLSAWEALTPLYRAQAARVPITAETCPHYLSVVAEEIPDGAPQFACAPPVRKRENREYLWAALTNGLIRAVVSDHVETARADHCGVNSIQFALPATWTGARSRGYTIEQVADWMCRAPARLAGFARKGKIEAGFDADLVVLDPDGEFDVATTATTPYAGVRLRGVVERTYVRGNLVYSRENGCGSKAGRVVVRGTG